MYSEDGALVVKYPIPLDLREDQIDVYFCIESNEAILLVQRVAGQPLDEDGASFICRINADGQETERVEVPALALKPAVHRVYLCPMPLAILPVIVSQAGVMADRHSALSLGQQVRLGISGAPTEVAVASVLTVVALFLLWLHRERRIDRDFWIWAGVVAVLGIPGYIGYRLHRPQFKRVEVAPAEPSSLEVFA